MDRDEILRVLRAFEESGLEYVLIGATAMGFHGVVRATEDIDLRPAALYRLKRGTVRPKDHQDAAALRERFDLKDEEEQ